jgi:hypothetical protein
MVGSVEALGQAERDAHLQGLERFQAALEKLHLAEAELARVRVDLAKKGVILDVEDDLHW